MKSFFRGVGLLALFVLFVGAIVGYIANVGNDAKSAAYKYGFSEVETHGWAPFGCHENEGIGIKFTAKNVRNEPVSGVACCNFITGCNLRF